MSQTQVGGNAAAGLHTASAMDKKDCPAGKKWDRLVNTCIPGEKERSKGADDPSPCKGLCASGGARVGVDEGPNLENVTPLFLIPNGRPKTEARPEPGKPTGEFH